MKHARALLVAVFALVASCSDSEPDGFGASGTVTFNLTGVPGGPWNVSGRPPVGQSQAFTTSWSAGLRNDGDGILTIVSNRAQGDDVTDNVLISIPRLTPGTEDIDLSACTGNECAEFGLLLGWDLETDDIDYSCELTAGSLTISSISSSRAAGTFSGFGTCIDSNFDSFDITVNSGTFDVGIAGGSAILLRAMKAQAR